MNRTLTDRQVDDLIRRLPKHRSAQLGFTLAATTGRLVVAVDKTSGAGDSVASFGLGVTPAGSTAWSGLTATMQGNPFSATQDPGNNGWSNVQAVRQDTGSIESGASPTLTNNTARTWEIDCQPFVQVGFNITALTGVLPINITTFFRQYGLGLLQAQSTSQAVTGTLVITATSANALAVGQSGATNPAFNVNSNTASSVTGVTVVSNTLGSGVAIQATTSGTNEVLTLDAAAAALVKIGSVASTALGLQVGSSTAAAGTQLIVQSTNAAALVVGRLGATTPAFSVNANAATSTTGIKITAAANAGGVAIAAIGGNNNENMTIDSVGSGPILIAGTSTGGCNVRIPVSTAAAVGTTIANVGTTLKEGFNYITAANNALAVQLPAGAVGMQVTVVNAVYTAGLIIFPQVNAAINNLTANASYNLGNGGKRTLYFAATNQWYTDLVAID